MLLGNLENNLIFFEKITFQKKGYGKFETKY